MSVCGNHRQTASQAIRTLRRDVRWKPQRDIQHLAKWKIMGHLPDATTIEDYNALIIAILSDASSLVYHYPFGARDYYAVSGKIGDTMWLVIFGEDGILETAFPPGNLSDYLTKRGLVLLGHLEEVGYA